MPAKAEISPAMEDYLEVILRLSRRTGFARARDIASALDVKRSSVTGALRHLAQMKLVNYKPYEFITLTPKGRGAARRVTGRHEALARFFREVLGVPGPTADSDACRIEHGLSRETVDRLMGFMEFLEECPRAGEEWVRRFRERCGDVPDAKTCLECIATLAVKSAALEGPPVSGC
ncbi:MAG: metal-dependent transcriptional regulator [Planctomycetota bacterium]